MPLDPQITSADRDRLFDDFGRPAVLREVTQFYDPNTGQLDESFDDYPVTAVISPRSTSPTARTGGQHASTAVTILVKTEDVPAGFAFRTARCIVDGESFQIDEVEQNAEAAVFALTANRC